MNNNLEANIRCPFYLRHGRGERKVSITCWPIMPPDRLGFNMIQQTGFKSIGEFMSYTGIFCCDMYETCPVYKAILSNQEDEDEKKEKDRPLHKQAASARRDSGEKGKAH